MDRRVELLKRLQGNMSQNEFALVLDVTPAYISRVYSGDREPGTAIVRGLLRSFPDARDEVLRVWYLGEAANG